MIYDSETYICLVLMHCLLATKLQSARSDMHNFVLKIRMISSEPITVKSAPRHLF